MVESSPRPRLRPETNMQTDSGLGISKDLEKEALDYLADPSPQTKFESPVQKAIDRKLIGGADENVPAKLEDYKVKISRVSPEGREAIRKMASNVLGANFEGDLNEFWYCTTFISDMLDSLGADPLKDKGDRYNRTRANAFMKYGTPVDIEDIQEGDIVIFDFPKDDEGYLTLDPNGGTRDGHGDHATFYAGSRLEVNNPESNYIGVLGGEQGPVGAISMTAYDKSHILGVRRIQYNNIDYNFTKELAKTNEEFNKFLDDQAKAFDFNAFMNQYSDPMSGYESGFNKGGAAMGQQMEMAFMKEGGIKDDGMKTDPVSGNPIPPGSMATEVRDDIPAMLSEGEYVVPADVLRYYGVNFFEGLRNKAKSGLQSMEQNGRIGGEPLSPEQVQKNMGKAPQAGAPAPMPVQAADGVLAGQPAGLDQAQQMAQNFNPMNYGVVGGSTLGGGQQQQESVTSFKTFVNAQTGDRKILEYLNGQLKNKSDEQFTSPPYYEFGSAALKKAQQAAETPTPTDNGGPTTPPPEPKDPNEWAKEITDPTAWADKNLQGKANSVIDTVQLGTSVARVNAMAIVAEAQGNKELANQLRGKAREFVAANPVLNALPNAWIDGDQIAKQIQKDPTITEQILGKSVKTTDPKQKPQEPQEPPKPPTSKQKEEATKAVSDYSSKKSSYEDNGPQIVTQKSIDQTKAIMEKAATTADNLAQATTNLERTTSKIEDLQSGKNTSGQVGFKSGGLMAKKKKK